MKVLIGYDGSRCSDAAIEDLRKAGLAADTEALVVTVGEYWLPPPASYGLVKTDFTNGPEVVMREAKELAAVAREKLRAAFPKWTVHAEERGGSPARQILEVVDEWKPDLVVVGSHGRTGLAKLFLGSVSQKLASQADCSVRIARGRLEERDEPVRILVGIDGSEGANAAVRVVSSRTWPEGSRAKLATAFGPLSIDAHELKGELARIHILHNHAVEQLAGAGLDVTSVIEQADPRELLVREAATWGADCIFLGATGLLLLQRFLFGTVVAAVTARAHCSVEVVRERL